MFLFNSHVADVQQEAVLVFTEGLSIRPALGGVFHPVAGVAICIPSLIHIRDMSLLPPLCAVSVRSIHIVYTI